ncbi:hypothetical protein KPH14_009268 [Odynerus spinipes]|uniref:Uncharacterized protein n=1 Tax=Odynerus spinipes TaxID=1348599 RepID=A0AAD9RPH1_9HYME|nr:hypothetical protein KPH14_009268 [Odynerus spinipes]
MENTFRIIYALCIIFLRFPLYYLAPVAQISYTDVINNDTSLCDNSIKQFLCQSKFTKDCTQLNYPQNIDKLSLDNDNVETFLCLGMHDTIYKICQYIKHETWSSTFSKQEDLDLSIQKLTEFKPNDKAFSQSMTSNTEGFCKNLSEFTPMYDKVQPALSKLAKLLKNLFKCNQICFDINDSLNPLCAVLAWINQIDQTIKKNAVTTKNSKPSSTTNDNSNIPKSVQQEENRIEQVNIDHEHSANIQNAVSSKGTKKNDMVTQNVPNIVLLNANKLQPSINSFNNDNKPMPKEKVLSTVAHSVTMKQNSTTTNSASQTNVPNPIMESGKKHSQPHDIKDTLDSVVIDTNQPAKEVSQKDDIPTNDNRIIDTNKNVNNKAISPSVEDVKSTTLSENTQDSIAEDNAANIANHDDFNHIEDDPLSNGNIESLGQPIDTDNQNENIPEISGQRESFRVIKNDEESHFFTYFTIISLGFIAGYIGYHNKQKILAIVLEGRRSKNNRGRRRPSTANYRKLDCTLEEAVTSQCNANVTHVIY